MLKWITPLICSLACLLSWGCGSACRDLANKVCDCQPTRAKKERCEIAVSVADDNLDASDAEEEACQQILDSGSCTCDAVLTGDLAACGLAHSTLDLSED
ncbi:MAG: hypothetical protein JXR96_24220 [Deltaproteobacteria bacterium]|nr:hypothetical protein [Deltaproteobacteria bacterium]